MQAGCLSAILKERADSGIKGITFIAGSDREDFLSYRALYKEALRALAFLQQRGLRPRNQLVIQVDDSRIFLVVFWACILGGIIPVPVTVGRKDDHRQKLFNIWKILDTPFLMSSDGELTLLAEFAKIGRADATFESMVGRTLMERDIFSSNLSGAPYQAAGKDIAFIQFSSGSTGDPKGVVLTHENLVTNMKAISNAAGYTADDSTLSWMPLTHDMGLIGFHLNPLFSGMNQLLIPTSLFVRNPTLWFDKASEHKASILSSPNFGFRYLITHYDRQGSDKWDLSGIRLLYNGAEPISGDLSREFLGLFSRYGLQSHAMCPVYGLAEATLAVTISNPAAEMISLRLRRSHLKIGEKIVIEEEKGNGVEFVNVGKPVSDCAIRIADEQDISVGEGIIGHIRISGPNVTTGYYNNDEATKEGIDKNGWLRTGDLGFIHDGSLFVTGRAKDIIFVNGENYYPHDIERAAEEADGVELNKIAVAGYSTEAGEEEIIAFVYHRAGIEKFVPIARSVRAIVRQKTGLEIGCIVPVKMIPKTTSGKLQRFRLLEMFKEGAFEDVLDKIARLDPRVPLPASFDDAGTEEEKLLRIWRRLLNTDQINIDESFFDLGGNSLKAAELGMILEKEFGVDLPIKKLHETPSVRSLTKVLMSLAKSDYCPIPGGHRSDEHPLSSAQRRIYAHCAVNKRSIAYNIPIAFALHEELETGRLETCIRQLIRRHDALRMSFTAHAMLTVQEEIPFLLMSQACARDEAQETLKSWVQPFDLAAPPLFRSGILRTEDGDLLFLDFHHIISDGLSVYRFIDELLHLYRGQDLPSLPIRYTDYIYWESSDLVTERMQHMEAHWLDNLGASLPKLEMPVDFKRPVMFQAEGSKLEFQIARETAGRLKEIAAMRGCTMHVLLFAIYNVLLSKYTGQDDLVVGIPVAGRQHPDLQSLQGMFVNNLALRTVIRNEESFSVFLESVRRTMEDALNHQDYPYDRLIRGLGGHKDTSRNPVFDTMFIYQNMGVPGKKQQKWELTRVFFDPGSAKFDISMEVFDDGDSLTYAIEYATALFRKETAIRFARHFEQLVRRIIGDADTKLKDLSLISDMEYKQYVHEYNATETPYPSGSTIHQLFDEQVRRDPDGTAVEDQHVCLSYRQLQERADRLAGLLRKKGLRPGLVAGILLNRSPELLVAILGVLKAGGCYLPIETGLPAERIQYLVADSRSILVVSDQKVAGKLPGNLPIVLVDSTGPDDPGGDDTGRAAGPEDLAYVLYTSGTTGRPKGVMIEHRSLVNYVCWAASKYIRGEKASFPLFTSISFDLTVTSIFTPLVTGNRIMIYDDYGTGLPIERVIADNKSDIIKLTPSHLGMIVESPLPAAGHPFRVRRLIVGGEQLDTRLAERACRRFGNGLEIYNEYGPTEACVGCMIHVFSGTDGGQFVPIGVPAANTRIYLLDKYLFPVPEGLAGEIYISGAGVARGYLYNEALTTEKFMPDPFLAGSKMYKTGDIARRLPGGRLEFAGRADQQVKINGFRIELAEIEHRLLEHPGIVKAVVVVKQGRNGKSHLYAYYQKEPGCANGTHESILRAHLSDCLPYYMIPAQFIEIDHIPLTQNGKVDYPALPEPGLRRANADHREPHNEIQERLMGVWSELLGEEQFSVKDNFFELGGDSIKAVQIVSQLLEQGIVIEAKDILTYQTIEEISRHAKAGHLRSRYEQGILRGKAGMTSIAAWFFEQNFKNPHHYNQSVLLRPGPNVNADLLGRALQVLILHHDGLRINYDPGRHVLFYNDKHVGDPLPVSIVEAHHDALGGPDVREICRQTSKGFNIAQSLLIKAVIIRESGKPDLCFITAHHLVMDGVSWRIFLEDLYTVCEALIRSVTPHLPPKTASLADWEKEMAGYSISEAFRNENAYWEAIERELYDIPTDFETEDWKFENIEQVFGTLNAGDTQFLLKQANRVYRTNTPILLETALALTLREWLGKDEVIIELEGHGRELDNIDLSRTIGWFTSMYPVKIIVKDDELGRQIRSIKEQLRSIPGNGIGYGVFRYLKKGPGRREGSLTGIRFNYLGQFDHEMQNELFAYDGKLTSSNVDTGNKMTAKIEIDVMIIRGELNFQLSYNKKAYKASAMNALVLLFFDKLKDLLTHIKNQREIYFSPSDFSAVRLDQGELDELFL